MDVCFPWFGIMFTFLWYVWPPHFPCDIRFRNGRREARGGRTPHQSCGKCVQSWYTTLQPRPGEYFHLDTLQIGLQYFYTAAWVVVAVCVGKVTDILKKYLLAFLLYSTVMSSFQYWVYLYAVPYSHILSSLGALETSECVVHDAQVSFTLVYFSIFFFLISAL